VLAIVVLRGCVHFCPYCIGLFVVVNTSNGKNLELFLKIKGSPEGLPGRGESVGEHSANEVKDFGRLILVR
jgi:hypothetical protein